MLELLWTRSLRSGLIEFSATLALSVPGKDFVGEACSIFEQLRWYSKDGMQRGGECHEDDTGGRSPDRLESREGFGTGNMSQRASWLKLSIVL